MQTAMCNDSDSINMQITAEAYVYRTSRKNKLGYSLVTTHTV